MSESNFSSSDYQNSYYDESSCSYIPMERLAVNCANNFQSVRDKPEISKDPVPDDINTTRSVWYYIGVGLLSGLFIGFFLYIADRFGSFWGAMIAAIPFILVAAAFFINERKLEGFTFALILGNIASLIAVTIFFLMLFTACYTKTVSLIFAFVAWIIVIGILFWYFKPRIEKIAPAGQTGSECD